MNVYLVLKSTGNGTNISRSAVVLPLSGDRTATGSRGSCSKVEDTMSSTRSNRQNKKSFRVVGNIPELYHGMIINLELNEKKFVLDYSLVLNDKNIAALKKANVDPEEYRAILDRHTVLKKDGVGWNVAQMNIKDVYRVLPFGQADKLHKEMIDNSSEPTRIEVINKKIIKIARDRRKIAYKIEEYLGYFDEVEQEGAYQRLMVSLKILCLQASRYGVKDGTVWDSELKAKEDYIKDNIDKRKKLEYRLLSTGEIQTFLRKNPDLGLEQEQIDALWCLKDSAPCIITGGAGTGKTTVVQTLIDCYSQHYPVSNVLLVAPTGKASRRLAEKTGLPASTIHKALRKTPEDNFVFYSEYNPLPHRLIIVDESSMIDTALMFDLLGAVSPTSKIIFIGDHNQLYPVGYGEPFFDFMKELSVFRLTKNHRQSEGTDILLNANNVLNNLPISSGRGVKVENITYDDIGDILSAAFGRQRDVDDLTAAPVESIPLTTTEENTQIISPYNDLNAQINSFLKKGEDKFNVGDKVIMLKNTKEYCNGDIGVITGIDGDGTIAVDIDKREVLVTEGKHNDISLAYAITVHKMQGSEADRVIVFIPKGDRLVNERLLYTAITRAKKELEVYFYV